MKALLIVDVRIFACLEAPFLLARLRVKRVEIAVPATDVDSIVRNCRGGMDDVTSSKLPLQDSGDSIYTVNISIAAADVDPPVVNCRRRCVDVPRIRNGLEAGRIAVQPFDFEPSLIQVYKIPFNRDR